MSKIQERGQKYLEQNKTVKEVHITSDGTPFLQKQNANAHATTLENKEVQTLGRGTKDITEAKTLTEAEKEAVKVAADKKASEKKVADAKKKAAAKKKADVTEKAKTNSVGQAKNSANTGADQKTAK
jgi:hypothetical protein